MAFSGGMVRARSSACIAPTFGLDRVSGSVGGRAERRRTGARTACTRSGRWRSRPGRCPPGARSRRPVGRLEPPELERAVGVPVRIRREVDEQVRAVADGEVVEPQRVLPGCGLDDRRGARARSGSRRSRGTSPVATTDRRERDRCRRWGRRSRSAGAVGTSRGAPMGGRRRRSGDGVGIAAAATGCGLDELGRMQSGERGSSRAAGRRRARPRASDRRAAGMAPRRGEPARRQAMTSADDGDDDGPGSRPRSAAQVYEAVEDRRRRSAMSSSADHAGCP